MDMGFITRIQKKSPEIRTLYAFWVALIITGIITLVWFTALPAKLKTVSTKESVPVQEIGDVFEEAKEQAAAVIDSTRGEDVKENNEGDTGEALSRLTELRKQQEAALEATTTESAITSENTTTSTDIEMVEEEIMEENEPIVEEAEPVRRVILIGTTTIQKSE